MIKQTITFFKKTTIFYGILLLFLAILPSQQKASAALDCEWTLLQWGAGDPYNNRPGYCVGGFSSEAELKASTVTFGCQGWFCGNGFQWLGGVSQTQSLDIPGDTPEYDPVTKKYFTCIPATFDSSFIASIKTNVGIFTGKTCASEITLGSVITIKTPPGHCIDALRKLVAPKITGTTSGAGGSCESSWRVNLSESGEEVVPAPGEAGTTPDEIKNICSYVTGKYFDDCMKCFSNETKGAWTAIGCISAEPTGPNGFVTVFLRFGIGIAGGVAFLLILWGGFQIITSGGNPEQLNSGRELVGAAISGLLVVIFSLFLLRLIGVNILGIPGFS